MTIHTRRCRPNALALAASLTLIAATARGQQSGGDTPPADTPITVAQQLERVDITGRHYDNAVGSSARMVPCEAAAELPTAVA